jgi:monoamine oxidase
VGGGAAGLAAARVLASSGVDVAVVEARARLGGRIWTVKETANESPTELGAEFVHGEAPHTAAIARDGGLELAEWQTQSRWWRAGAVESSPERDDAMKAAMRKAADVVRSGADRSFAEALVASGACEPGRSLAREYVESFQAADAARISARALAAGDVGAQRTRRLTGGYGGLVATLANRSPSYATYLGRVARSIHWSEGRVEIRAIRSDGDGPAETFASARAIVALPLPILRELAFEPALDRSAPKAEALDRVATGSAVRVHLTFDRAFWAARAPAPFLLHVRGADFPVFWTGPDLDSAQLVAWAGGAAADRLRGMTRAELAVRATAILSKVFTVPLASIDAALHGVRSHDWTGDRFARGAYSYPLVGGRGASGALAAPLDGTLFFAGEFTSAPPSNGTVEGAIASGVRAAREVLARMGRAVPLQLADCAGA